MKYRAIMPGKFVDRPNRFIAHVEIADETGNANDVSKKSRIETVHVKNTGRCKELLQPGAEVFLEKCDNPTRSTVYDLVAVRKGNRLVNMDSQAPNKAVGEWLLKEELFQGLILIRPETKFGNSRFDFYVETKKEKIFIEVKGVTLEQDGVVRFPDAPSERAVKHVEELIQAKKEGYRVCVLFVIQMEGVRYFCPNRDTHEAFAEALCRARDAGVEVFAYECKVTTDSMELSKAVPVYLTEEEVRKSFENLKIMEIPKPLLAWYDNNRRVLPWREEPTPYRVWVSEIMLQQTRVEAVKPYFERFMKQLPDIASLAVAPEEILLKLWEGLGYYNRVRNLQRAAQQIMEEYAGEMPAAYEELLQLKGIGSYTAGAISSIAFGLPNPAVDGNVLRVIARIRKDERLITDVKVKTDVEKTLRQAIPADRPGAFNQALMEIGACVCIPNGAPHCKECPLAHLCEAHQDGTELMYPKKAKAKARTTEQKTILVIRDENRTVIRKRKESGLLQGMYEFPSLEGFHTAEEVTEYLAENGLRTIRIQALEDAKHIFTHKEWHMKGYMIRVDELEPKGDSEVTRDWIYTEPETTQEKYPIPSAYAAYTKVLSIKLGNEKYKPGKRK